MSRNDELVAVVTGGSRGIGKGVARALAERGATVYIAGRSQAGGIHTSPGGALLPGTIQEAVEEVNSLGGRGIAVASDLSVDEEIRSLFERVRQESGAFHALQRSRDLSMAWICCYGTLDATHGDRSGRQAAQGEDGI